MTKQSLLLTIFVSVLLTSQSIAFAADIEGKVSKLDGQMITIASTSAFLPAVGDKFGVFVEIPGVGRASVGSGTIIRVEENAIVARIEKATGRVSTGQLVVITSPKPQKRPATKTPILLGRNAKAARKVIEDAGFVTKVEVGVDAPARVEPFTVYAQDPAPNTALAAGDSITITLYGGEVSKPSPSKPIDSSEPDAANYKVGDRVVVLYDRKLTGAGEGVAVWVGPGFVKTIEELNDSMLRITNGRSGWINQADVVPFNAAATERFTRMIAENPGNPAHYRARGRVHRKLHQYEQAVSDLDESIRLQPLAMDYHERGLIRYEQGELDKAIADYNESLKLEPKLTYAHTGRGLAWLKMGEYEKAVAAFTEAKRLDPQYPASYKNFAWLRATCPAPKYRDGKLAVEQATEACALSGWTHADCIDALAAAYAETGDFETATKWQKKAIELAHARRKKDFQKRLELYHAEKPYREIPVGNGN